MTRFRAKPLALISTAALRSYRGIRRFKYQASATTRFVLGAGGSAYGVSRLTKVRLATAVARNARSGASATTYEEQLELVREILSVPPATIGDVAEFGCYKGASTASLSLACAITGRRLVVFDSFEGLPAGETAYHLGARGVVMYHTGEFAGSLEEVRETVRRGGDLSVCEFVQGYFQETLPHRPEPERYAMIFEDADLEDSVRSVLRYAWPRLAPHSRFYSHEAFDPRIVRLFFDDAWWREELGLTAPGIVGSGLGLPLSPWGSNLAYATRG